MERTADEQRWARWMLAAQAGDQGAYASLLGEIADVVRRYLHRQFAHAEFVDDCVQECLMAVHTARHSYQAGRPFRPWLLAIARHKAIDQLRSDRRRGEFTVALADPDVIAFPGTDSDDEASAELAGDLLRQLPKDARDALILTKLQGYSTREAAERCGCSVAAMKVRVHRAVRAARRVLEQDDAFLDSRPAGRVGDQESTDD